MSRKRSARAWSAASSRSLSRATPAALSRLPESGLEGHRVHSLDHLGEHLHEPAARVPSDVHVAGAPGHALDRSLGQPEVEDGVQHAGHRYRRPGANREQQRVVGIAELLPARRAPARPRRAAIWSSRPAGSRPPLRMYSTHAAVVMVKPPGTFWAPSTRVISARFAPLLPSSSRISAEPSSNG